MTPTGVERQILLVEDSAVEAEFLRRSLDRGGYSVRLARDGEAGLDAARRHRPDLVVSDINMPRMNGYELCHAIKSDEATWNIPVLLLSVLSEPEDIIAAMNAGADGYITKPYNESSLLERIRSLLAVPMVPKRGGEILQVEYGGKHHSISVDSQQMLNLLLSVYENTLLQNRELTRTKIQLNQLNDSLEEQVRQRTAQLLAEEQEQERLNVALRTLSACNVALVHAQTEEQLFQDVCRHIVETGGHLLAWVEYPGEAGAAAPRLGAHFGNETAYHVHTKLAEAPEHADTCLAAIALRTRRTQVCNQLNGTPECMFGPLSAAGVGAVLALPLVNDGEIYGVLTVFSATASAFDTAEIALLEELAGDLGYGIATLRTRGERDQKTAQLRQALEQTIAAIGLTLEKRDPYTAGHQARVAEIASAIAAEMGLPTQRAEGIHFGALIHDIGKVYVPAEILSRPGKLPEMEFKIIKKHPDVGYDIVKDIPFPWPVARMVHEHHERLDGSGYPRGLKGDEIMLEARILAVADVLEAMTAHRPYRPGLGVAAALEVLEQGRGTLFDAGAVTACLRLIREKGYVVDAG